MNEPRNLSHVVFDKCGGHVRIPEVTFGLGLAEGGHVEEFAVGKGVVEAAEGDGLNVVDEVGQLFGYFLKNETIDENQFTTGMSNWWPYCILNLALSHLFKI